MDKFTVLGNCSIDILFKYQCWALKAKESFFQQLPYFFINKLATNTLFIPVLKCIVLSLGVTCLSI